MKYSLTVILVFCLCWVAQSQVDDSYGPWYIYESEKEDIPTTGWEVYDLEDDLPKETTFWLKTTIDHQEGELSDKILYLGDLQEVKAYVGDNRIELVTGTLLLQEDVALPGGKVIYGCGFSAQVPLSLSQGANEVVLRISSPFYKTEILDARLYDRESWYVETSSHRSSVFLVQGFLTGALVIISVYHFLIFLIRRDRPFLWYAVYTLSMATVMFLESGVMQAMLGDINQYALRMLWETQILSFISSLLYFAFMRSFLDLDKLIPWLDKLILRYLVVYTPISLLFDAYYVYTLEFTPYSHVLPLIMLTSGLICVIIIFRTGNRLAIYFSIGSLLLYSGAMTNTLISLFINLGWMSDPTFPRIWFTEIGVMLEILVFSLGLGYRLRMLDQEREMAVTRLRTKISSDLHDDVGSMLTGLSMQSNVMSYTTEGPIKEKLKQISEISRNALETMRDTVWAIDARQDNYTSLIDKVRDFAETNIPADRLSYTVRTLGIDDTLSIAPDVRQQVYLIYKEAFTNASKHSNGSHIDIKFLKDRDYLYMHVADDGSIQDIKEHAGLGLKNMKMRAQQIGGQLELSTDDGWRVILKVPV